MVVKDDGPLPRLWVADIDTSMSPSPTVLWSAHGSGLMEGTTHIPCLQYEDEIIRELQVPPVLESI